MSGVAMPWDVRLQQTMTLWPYMAPLFLVFSSEYAMQSGESVYDVMERRKMTLL